MFPKPTYKTGGTNTRKPSKNDRAMVSGVSSILRKIKDKKNRKEVAGDMVNQFNREGVNYNKEKFLKNSRSFQTGGPVKPYYTSNPKDPRFRAFKDSSDLYQSELDLVKAIRANKPRSVISDLQRRNLQIWGPNAINTAKPISSTGNYTLIQNTANGKQPWRVEKYKKPTQPVIYKPAAKKSTMTTMSKTPVNKPKPIISTTIRETTTNPTITPTQTPRQLPVNSSQTQRYNYMSTEDKKRAVKKYGDPSKIPFQGVDVNQLRKEVPTFQGGGTRRPIYVSDPRDPRLRSYNDSFNLYKENFNQLRSERLNYSPKFLKRIPFNSIKDNEYAQDMFERNDAFDIRSKGEVYPEKIKPIYFDINKIGDKTQHSAYYKKPVQPVVLDPLAEIKRIKPMGLRENSMTPSISGPMSVNIPMRARKQLPTVKHTNNYENFDIKVHNTPGERFYREVVTPMKKEKARKPVKHIKNYPDTPGRGYKSGGQHGGLDRWFAEKWVDVKSGKPCGRQEGENRAYPACRPSKRISSKTPKTSSELSSKEKARFKSTKTSSQRIPYNHKRMQLGGMSSSDSARYQANKILKYEQLRGGPGGTPLPQYSDPKYMNMLMNDIYPEVKKIMPNATAMEAGEAMDFIFNAGWDKENKKILKDPRGFALQEYYRQYDKSKLDKDGNWPGRKQPISNELYANTIGKLPENQRRVLMNKGRDWYYKNTNNPAPGIPNPNYGATWYGRIWNTNDFLPFNPNNPKFIYKNK
jgi:hypothetical protein